jgi:outer membrane protein TolC
VSLIAQRKTLRLRATCLAAAVLGVAGCTVLPKPLTVEERTEEAQFDRLAMFADQEPLTRSLTLTAAFDRAIKYNLDARVKAMEAAVALEDLDLANYEMLPKVAINAAGVTRSNREASSSQSVETGQQSLEPSTSTDRSRFFGDLTLSWNILDFGVSYYNARQAADRTLIAEERRRRVLQGLLQDVRRAYWRAASAERLAAKVRDSIRAAEAALPAARRVETEGLRSPVDALRYQKALLDLLRQLESVQEILQISKTELASLIGLPPGKPFRITVPRTTARQLPPLPMSILRMEETALLLNPDIRELSYERRISVAETRKALLRLLPGINLTAGPHYDTNSFLVNQHWVAAAAYLNGYLNTLITAPTVMRRAENSEILTDTRRQAVSMAVLAKLHIAREQYLAATREYRRSSELSDVDQRLYQQIANRVATDAQGELEKVSAQVSALYSELRAYQSFAEAQAAIGRLYAALGLDQFPDRVEVLTVLGLNDAIKIALRSHAEPSNIRPAGGGAGDGAPAADMPADVRPAQQSPSAAAPADAASDNARALGEATPNHMDKPTATALPNDETSGRAVVAEAHLP